MEIFGERSGPSFCSDCPNCPCKTEDFGVLAVLLVFINLSNVLIQKGFATALVQKEHIEDIDINTVFWISELIAAFLYILLWCFAPLLENVYGTLHLASYLRIISISLFAGAFYSIENSLLIRSMQFKKMFFSSFAATLIAGTLAMVLAYKGMGCWALIWQNIVQQILLSVFSLPFCNYFFQKTIQSISEAALHQTLH